MSRPKRRKSVHTRRMAAHKEQRREAALLRQEAYDKLSLTAKLNKAIAAPGESKREIKKLKLKLKESK